MSQNVKPLGRKAYGSIGHLPCSRMGPGDHAVPEGMQRICCEKARDSNDRIIVQEKLDGACVAIAKIDGKILALGRAGYLASTSPFVQHHVFAKWVEQNELFFGWLLYNEERLVGEWMAQACGTRYQWSGEPFVAFDIMVESRRLSYDEFFSRIHGRLPTPALLHDGGPIAVGDFETRGTAMYRLGRFGHHGACDVVEGLMYRVERKGEVNYLAKYVRPDKKDGIYLPEVSGKEAVWNWHPDKSMVWYKQKAAA